MKKTIEEIHLSFVNGQRRQAVEQMENYGMYDFFEDYNSYLTNEGYSDIEIKNYVLDAVNSYFRIKNR
jgi:hypothetical protein